MVSQHEEADAQCGELATHGANEERCPSHCKYEKGCKSAEEHNDGLDSHLRGEGEDRRHRKYRNGNVGDRTHRHELRTDCS